MTSPLWWPPRKKTTIRAYVPPRTPFSTSIRCDVEAGCEGVATHFLSPGCPSLTSSKHMCSTEPFPPYAKYYLFLKEELRAEKAKRKAMQSSRLTKLNSGSEREGGPAGAGAAARSFDGAVVAAAMKEREEPTEEMPLFDETHVKLLVVSFRRSLPDLRVQGAFHVVFNSNAVDAVFPCIRSLSFAFILASSSQASAAFCGLSHSERVHLVVGCLEHQLAYESKLRALEQPWADPRWSDEEYSDDEVDDESSDSNEGGGEEEKDKEDDEQDLRKSLRENEEGRGGAAENFKASLDRPLPSNSNVLTTSVVPDAKSKLLANKVKTKRKKVDEASSSCRAPLLPFGAGGKLKHVGVVGAHVRSMPGWSGGASMSHAAEGWHHSHLLNKKRSRRGKCRRELWCSSAAADDGAEGAYTTATGVLRDKAGRKSGDGNDDESKYPSYRRLKRRRCPQPLPALLLDLRTPNQWRCVIRTMNAE